MSTPLRVALDTSFAGVNRTGVGLYSRELAAHLGKLAHVSNIALRCYGPACGPSQRAGLVGTMQEWPVYTQLALPILLAGFRPDIAHSTSHIGPIWGRGRHIVTVHDLIFMRYPEDYNPLWLAITRLLLPRVLARACIVIADSETTKADLCTFFGYPSHKIRVIYPGINSDFNLPADSEVMAALRRRLGIGDSRYILCLGPWVKRKNLEVVVRAFPRLAELLPDVHLVITGSRARGMKGTPVEDAVQSRPASTGSKVHLTGYVAAEELRSLAQGASALAYPSRFEGFGLPPLEAMSASVPTVVSNTPAVIEATGGAALVADPDRPEEWADAFFHVLTDPDKAAQLVAAGKRRASCFSWERCARETVELYGLMKRET